LRVAVAFGGGRARRIWTFAIPARQVTAFVGAYLTSALAARDGRAYLVDGTGRVVASSGGDRLGAPVPDRRALTAARVPAERDGAYVVSAPLRGTAWRIVFIAPKAGVLAPVAAANRQGWWLFGGLGLVVLLLIGAAVSAVRQASRLAFERPARRADRPAEPRAGR
jgi:hypothetical protein